MKFKIRFRFVIILLSFIFLGKQALGQKYNTDKIEIYDNIKKLSISTQGVYLSYEKKLINYIYTYVGLSAVYGYSSTEGSRWAVSPVLSTEGRWYFNYKHRFRNGKKLLFNAADFLSLRTGYIFKPIEVKSFAYINSMYFLTSNIGMQRTWGKHISFELKLGLSFSYLDEFNSFGAGPNFNLKIGYIFNK